MAFDELENSGSQLRETDRNWDNLSDRARRERFERYKRLGWELPENEGVLGETKKAAMGTGIDLLRGFGSTLEETTGYEGMREYFDEVKRTNHQYDPDPTYSPSSLKPSHVARTVTTGLVQSVGAIGAGMFGNMVGGPAGGLAAMGGFTFGQIYGDTVKEYRDAMPGEDEGVVKGLAFASAVGQSLLEGALGPEKVIAGFGKSFFSGALKETTRSLVKRMGVEAAKGAVTEGSEEVLQDFWSRICKGVAAKEGVQMPGWEEVRDQFMGGALPGTLLGGVAGVKQTTDHTDNTERTQGGKPSDDTRGPDIEGAPPDGADIPVSEETMRRSGQTAGEALLDALGVKHSRMTEEEQQTEGIGYVIRDGKRYDANGLFDKRTNEIKINPANVGEMFTHGHELDHWLEKNHKDLADQLHSVIDAELNEAGLADDESPVERRADMLGHILNDPKALQKTIEKAGRQNAAFGEKFLNAVIEFSKQVMAYMKAHAHLPGAEQYFNDYKRVRDTAVDVLVEVQKRNQAEAERMKAETPEMETPTSRSDTSDPAFSPQEPNTPSKPKSANAEQTLRTPDGSMEVKARFKVIPIEAAVHSDKAEYDQKLQPRNRDTKSSEAQINKMAGNIHPDLLLDSAQTDTGAPIVDPKNQVISGNGRVMALLRARGQNIQDYYAAVRKFAAENGIEIPEGLKNPLLVREVSGDTDLVKLAELSNRDNKLRRTEAEQAEADAKMIMDGNLLDIFNPSDDGAVLTAQNMGFVRQFINGTGDDSLRTTTGEAAAGAEGRIKRAVLAVLFNGQEDARTLIQKLIENATEEGLKRQVDGVSSAAGRIMKAAGREGYAHYDLRQELADAFRALLEYKRELQLNPKRYNGIDDYLDQGDMFGRERSPEVELLTRFLGNAKSIKTVRDALNAYADAVEKIDVHTSDMFGAKDEGKDSVLRRVLGVENKTAGTPANTRTNTDNTRTNTDNRGKQAETRDQKDSDRPAVHSSSNEGRFNQDSDTPLLTPEEDAGDFQLFAETPKEAAKRDQDAEKAEADKLERAKEEARRNAPELPLAGNEAPQSGMKNEASRTADEAPSGPAETKDIYARIRETKEGSAERVKAFMELPDGDHELGGKKFKKDRNFFIRDLQILSARGIEQSFRVVPLGTTDNTESTQSEAPVMTEDEFLAQRGLSMPVSDYMTDKQKIPHGETEAQRKQRIREADRIANEYAEARKKAKAEYQAKIENGEIRKPSEIEKLEKIAAGNPDNESVKAAKRVLEKRKKRAQSAANNEAYEANGMNEEGEVPKNYKRFDENGHWEITGGKNLKQLLDEFIAALRNKKCLKINTPKGDFHLEEFNGKFCYIDPAGRIRIWEENSVRSVLDRFIVSNNPKIQIVEESSTDAYKSRKILQDGSLLKAGDYAVFKHNGVFYEGEVASLGEKKVKLKTQSKMYGEQVISLPRESYLAHYPQSPFTLEGSALEEFTRENGSPEEYDKAKKSFMVQSAMKKGKPAREITSAAGKRADARTKHDVENFIGDGKQYSLRDNSDIQYSIVGEKGMENLSRESQEGLRRLEDLQMAKSLLKFGAKMDAIKFQTGWERGGDGKWRTELPDLKVKRKGVLPDGTEYEKNDVDYVTSGKLGEYIDAPEIFKAYPQLKNMLLTVSFHKGRTYGECIEKHFNLSTGEVSWPEIAIHLDEDLDVDVKEIEGLLIHEVQHAIQNIEGFSSGSNPKYFKDHPVKNPNRPEELEQAKQTLEKLKKQFPDQDTLKKADLWYETDIAFEHPLEYIQKGMDAIEDFFEQQGLSDLFNDYVEQRHHVRVLEGHEDLSPYTAYFRTAGEVESRNAERRSKMPLEQRLRKLLSTTEDVAEEDKIYLEKAVGEALSLTERENSQDDVQYSLCEFEDGRRFVDVKADQHLFDGLSPDDARSLAKKIIKERFVGKVIGIDNSVFVNGKSAGEYAYPAKPFSNQDIKQAKMRASSELDNLIDAGIPLPNRQDGADGHVHPNAVDGFSYLETIFKVGNEFYRGIVNIVNNERGRLLKDITKIENITKATSDSYGENPKFRNLRDVSMSNITESPADVNPDSGKNPENSSADQSDQSDENTEPYVQHSLVKDPGLLKKLDAEEKRGEYLTLYRAAQLRDGKLYSPMAAKINGEWPNPIQLGQWEQADEHPELIVKGNKFTLNKGNGATIDARYNPYIHSSPSPLNDQFSSAYKRPELVTLEVRVPKSELTSGYHAAHAKDSVGMQEWKAGTVSQKLSGRRQVMLSRYDKPIRIVPDSEVARKIAEMLNGKDITIPANVVTPSLRAELEKAGVKVDDGENQYSLRKHQQVNPIVVNGQVRAEYAELLDNKEFTPETIPEWDQKAIAWIDRQGGIEAAAEMIANDTEHSDRHVATLVRRHVLNSEFASSLPDDIRIAIELKNINEGKAWGREGAARRLAALTLKSIDSVKALFRKLHEKLPDKEKVKLRNKILEQTGVDINNLPDDLINDKSKLDAVLRAELANTSKWHDKAYEYWINAILSAPTTHSANIIGNTANTLYELGPKRFAEAAVNALAKRKDAATFGEFREMWNTLDFRSAWKKAKTAFDLETLTPGGKFRENAAVAIPGKLGRAVRTPGRLLIMADAFARELLIPAETAARAYREARNQGLTGDKMRSYIQQQMSNPGSTAYQAGKASAERIIFQEDPGVVLQRLIQLKASDGPGAQILKYLLPFVKTPGNILKQGIRKSPLGTLNLAWETVQVVRGKRAFDSEYLGHAAEQLIAWAAFLALGGFGDDDDDARPFLTGSSAPSGSGENGFKANTVPPYSIRIGDTYYSYRRIEPLATGLAAIADAHQAIREIRNGKEITRALNDMLRKTGKMISEKSYLDSVNQAVRFLEDPDRSLATFGTNFIASWIPNGMRAALNAGRDEVGDPKSRERGEEFLKDQFQVITSRMGFTGRAPKLDLFGHPITKEQQEDSDVTDFLWQLFVPVNRTAIDEDHPGKRLILNYNATHPESQWWGSIPNYRFTHNKERYYFDNEAYHQFAAEAGKLAEKQIYNAVRHGVIHPDNPAEKDIEIMKKIFTRARKETRQKFFRKAKRW